jgi:hypothetical protein
VRERRIAQVAVTLAWLVALAAGLAGPAGAQGGTPSVTGFDPSQGTVGSQVAITGTDFTAATDVQFFRLVLSPHARFVQNG